MSSNSNPMQEFDAATQVNYKRTELPLDPG